MIEVAKILKPQGLKGEIKCKNFTSLDFWRENLEVKIDMENYVVEHFRFYKDFLYLKLKDIISIDMAQKLRGKTVFVEKDLIKTGDDEYLISDLENCVLLDENGKVIGQIESVENYNATDIINVIIVGARFSFPFLKKVIKRVDKKNKIVEVYKDKLDEVLV